MSHSFLLRMNTIGTIAVTLLAILVSCASFTDISHTCVPTRATSALTPARVAVTGFERFVNVSGVDEAIVQLEFDVDMSSCFSWNTKLIFTHVVVSYATEERLKNEVTVWDAIALTPESSVIEGRKMAKYMWRDVKDGLRGVRVDVDLSWAVTPVVGKLWRGSERMGSFTMPGEYVPPRERPQAPNGGGRVPGMP